MEHLGSLALEQVCGAPLPFSLQGFLVRLHLLHRHQPIPLGRRGVRLKVFDAQSLLSFFFLFSLHLLLDGGLEVAVRGDGELVGDGRGHALGLERDARLLRLHVLAPALAGLEQLLGARCLA
jgi:hypothetical protein